MFAFFAGRAALHYGHDQTAFYFTIVSLRPRVLRSGDMIVTGVFYWPGVAVHLRFSSCGDIVSTDIF